MKVSLDANNIRLELSGLELLKLKVQIAQRIGAFSNSGKDFITFPQSALPLVADLIHWSEENHGKIKAILDRFNNHIEARTQALEILDQEAPPFLSINWNNTLDSAQVTAVAAMTTPNLLGLCLFDEQGSGKTVMTISAFDILKQRDEIDAMIVVCPKSMINEWPKDIQRFLGTEYRIEVAEGNQREKYEISLRKFDILVTNYEGIDVMLVSLLATASTYRYLLVVDESYYLKNSEAIRSEKISKLRANCYRCFVLCGTPAPNSAYDLVNQFDLADLGYTFAGFEKSSNPVDDWDKIASLIDTRGMFIRRLKSEVLEHVPEKNFHIIQVELTGKQAQMYELARSELELELRNFSNEKFKRNLASYFQRRSTLLQICSCPSAIDPTMSEPSAKYLVLDNLLSELISQGRKVILWSFYKKSLDELHQRYSQYSPVKVDGSIHSSVRKNAVRLFQEDPNVMLFIGNPAAAGAGITLHAAYDAVYISYSNQAAHYLQSLDRIHRRGQVSEHVNYYLLVCEGTIEETEVIRLREKEVRQHNLLGDHLIWPTSLDDALQELKGHD